MDKTVSIIKVDTRRPRAIARDNWGLTKEQIKGMHVHHRIPVSEGGTNDPTNLYVCGPWFHKNVWHAEDSYRSLIPYAEEGGRRSYDLGVGIHGFSEEERHDVAVRGGLAGGWRKSQEARVGIFGDRSEFVKVYRQNGVAFLQKAINKNPNHQSEAGRRGAIASLEKGVGLHAPGVAARGGQAGGRVAVESGQLARARTPESIRKGCKAAAKKTSKPVLCVETGVVYASASQAFRETGIHGQSISACCNKRRERAGGFAWEHVNPI